MKKNGKKFKQFRKFKHFGKQKGIKLKTNIWDKQQHMGKK